MLFGLLLLAFWPTLVSFPNTWNVSYQEQGYFVFGLVAWLVWRDRGIVARGMGQGLFDLLPIVALLSVAWLFAVIMNLRTVHQILFAGVLIAWGLASFGGAGRRQVLVIGTTFLLCIPFWGASVPVLQRATVIAAGAATRLAGIDAEVGYDFITISAGTFLVEAGCSGINYLMGGLVIGAFYAHLFTDRWQTQLKIVALAGAASILGNWIRVSILIFIGEATAMQSGLIEDHLWQGWAIFTLLMIPTYSLARRIQLRDSAAVSPRQEGENSPADDEAPKHVDPPNVRQAVYAGGAAMLGPILFMIVGAIPRSGEPNRDVSVLGIDASWRAEEQAPDDADWRPDFTGIDDVAAWNLRFDGVVIEGARYYFLDQRQGEELIQYNNSIAPDSLMVTDRLIGPIGANRRIVRQAIVRGPDAPRVVWYWYRVAGFDTPLASKAKLLEILAFFRRYPASELVTLSAECAPDDCMEAARALLAATGVPQAASRVAHPDRWTTAPS